MPSKTIDKNRKVEIYFNLHKKTWSVRQGGKVILHTNFIQIREPQYVVRQTGKEKVRREKRKNVHAFIKGTIEPEPNINGLTIYKQYNPITYNPYLHNSFICKGNQEPIHNADKVYLDSDLKAWAFTYEG